MIPYGYCHCGCGGKTTIAKQSISKRGVINGQPLRFITGHNSQKGVHPKGLSLYVRPNIPIEERFWTKVDIKGTDDCWEWRASKDANGYGLVGYNGKVVRSHRVSWILKNGEISENDLCVLHKCDNPSCVNPNHLFLGTKKDNNMDMASKGRHGQQRKKAMRGLA